MAGLPRNGELADAFELLADLSELLGEQGFRVQAYRRAATRIRDTPGSVAELALAGEAKELPGIGKTIEEKIAELSTTGRMEALEKRRAEVPPEVVLFLRLPGVGPKTAARIWRELDVTTLAELRKAAEDGRLRGLQGLGVRSEEKILEALSRGLGAEPERRGLLGDGLPVVQRGRRGAAGPPRDGRRLRGRQCETAEGDLPRPRRDRDLHGSGRADRALRLAPGRLRGRGARGDQGDGRHRAGAPARPPRRATRELWRPAPALHRLEGSQRRAARGGPAQRAVRLGVRRHGRGDGEVRAFRSEGELYAFLGYAYIPPELRENAGELEAARSGALPELVELGDLVGELHCHSTWSADGKDTIEAMAKAAEGRGYRYLCVTDHSHYLRDGRMEAQWEEIAALAASVKPFRVLRGVEANIRVDGSVDVPDEILAELDWVVASLHHSIDRNPTERILSAIDNPHVDCIGHLTGRRLSRPARAAGAAVDIEQIVARAVETGTALEINGQPDRLDLRDTHARLAGEAGVMIPITTDAHRVSSLAYAELGVAQARRAWLTRDQVLNTRAWSEIVKMRR